MINSILHKVFFRGVSIAPLVVFRIIFGALMLFGSVRFLLKGWVYDNYILPDFHFKYLGFEWVEKLPGNWMYLPFVLMILTSVLVIFGAFYRLAIVTLFLSFSYIELLDKTYYLNHYYFVSLMLFLMIFIPANKSFALDIKIFKLKTVTQVPAIYRSSLCFLLTAVYFFAGIAKIESDWLLNAQPLIIWLDKFHHLPLVGKLLANDAAAYFFAWFGLVYDLSVAFFLMARKTRPYAYIAVVSFHIITWLLFPIGVFPWVMIFSTLIFFGEDFHVKLLNRLKSIFSYQPSELKQSFRKAPKVYVTLIVIFMCIQIILPFRYLLYPGNLFWNEEGFRFSWRVMLMHKEGLATFYIEDKNTGEQIEIDNSDFLTESQEQQMATQPDFLIQYGHHLYDIYRDTIFHFSNEKVHLREPIVRADVKVSLNGRLNQQFVSKKYNFADLKYDLKHRSFIEKFID